MRGKQFVVVLSAALALIALSAATVVSGVQAEAGASKAAKPKAKGKGKACAKGKGQAKAKGKAKKSAALSAKPKGKKGKAKPCKPKKKPKGAGPKPVAPQPQPQPAPPAAWPPADGTYQDGVNRFDLILSGGGSQGAVSFAGGQGTCVPVGLSTTPGPTAVGAAGLTVQPPEVVVDHLPALGVTMKVALTVKPDLSYEAVIDSTSQAEGGDPCSKAGVHLTGTLVKR